MIQIGEPPTVRGCASCSSPLSWLWSPIKKAWICVVPLDATRFELHACQHAQDPATWRHIRQGSPPTGDYLEAKNKIAPKEAT